MADPLAPLRGYKVSSTNPFIGLGIVVATPLLILFLGFLFSEVNLNWGNATTDKEGNIVYANRITSPGISAVATAMGVGVGAYGAWKATKKEA